jgi:hypothetical protein
MMGASVPPQIIADRGQLTLHFPDRPPTASTPADAGANGSNSVLCRLLQIGACGSYCFVAPSAPERQERQMP